MDEMLEIAFETMLVFKNTVMSLYAHSPGVVMDLLAADIS